MAGPFLRRHEAGDAPAEQRVGPAIGQPQRGSLLVDAGDGAEHHFFVISHQIDDLVSRHRRAVDQPIHHLRAVEPAVDIVAKMDQDRLLRRTGGDVFGDQFVQGCKAVHAAVDVANGIDTLSRRQGRGGGGEFEHDRQIRVFLPGTEMPRIYFASNFTGLRSLRDFRPGRCCCRPAGGFDQSPLVRSITAWRMADGTLSEDSWKQFRSNTS
jgi:hypothetical protein